VKFANFVLFAFIRAGKVNIFEPKVIIFNARNTNISLLTEVSICESEGEGDLCPDLTHFLSRMCKIATKMSDVHHVISNRFLREQLDKSKTYRTQFEGKQKRLLSFVLLSLLSQLHLRKYQLHNLEHFQTT
jgi:hypothetical protein